MNFPREITLRSDPITPLQLALFAAASGDHNPLHLDPDAARRAGFDKPVAHGMLTMALAGRLFTHRFGARCIRQLHTRFVGVALIGDAIEMTATLERDEGGVAHYAILGVTARGTDVVVGAATVDRQA